MVYFIGLLLFVKFIGLVVDMYSALERASIAETWIQIKNFQMKTRKKSRHHMQTEKFQKKILFIETCTVIQLKRIISSISLV